MESWRWEWDRRALRKAERAERARLMFSVMEQHGSLGLLSDAVMWHRKPNEQKRRIIGKSIQCSP